MILETVASGGCRSYLIGCQETCAAALIDPELSQIDRYLALAARLLPRGQLELRVNQDLTDPTRRIIVYCEFGRVSTLATHTLRQMGFTAAVALDGGMKAWRESGCMVQSGKAP